MNELRKKLEEISAFKHKKARQHSYDLDKKHGDSPDYYNDTLSIIEGAHWEHARLAPLLTLLFDAVDALEFYATFDNWNAETGSISSMEPRGLSRTPTKVLDFGGTATKALTALTEYAEKEK